MVYRYRPQTKIKKDRKKLLMVAFVVVVLSIGYLLVKAPSQVHDIFILPDLSTAGYVEVVPEAAVVGDRGIISLTGGCYQVVATTEAVQAESIANGLAGKIDFRPNTHDLIKSVFDSLDIKVVMVKIVDLVNNAYIGRLVLRQGDKVLSLDSKPSDGIAIAVRYNATIYMKEDLLKRQGKYIC
jgi:bifunctional DNase/RNase